MSQGRIKKIFFTVMLFSLSAIILSSYSNCDLNQKSNAFAQTSDPLADPGSGPIPEDNSTSNLGTGPIPEDNSTSFTTPDISSPENRTDTPLPGEINSTVDNTIPQVTSNPPAVPEFGPLAGMIITISIMGVIVATKKFRLHI